MVTLKSLVVSFCSKSFSKKKLIYSLSSLFLVLYLLHIMLANQKQIKYTDYTTYSDVEREYRKRFNLMDRPTEFDEECNLGNNYNSLLYMNIFDF